MQLHRISYMMNLRRPGTLGLISGQRGLNVQGHTPSHGGKVYLSVSEVSLSLAQPRFINIR